MKRKLDANDVPSPEAVEGTKSNDVPDADFESLNLDPRLRQALIKEKFTKPTPVQAKAIPLALEGKDVLGTRWILNTVLPGNEIANEPSSCQNGLWQDRGLCAPDPADHSSEEDGLSSHTYLSYVCLVKTNRSFFLGRSVFKSHHRSHPCPYARTGGSSPESHYLVRYLLRKGCALCQFDAKGVRRGPTYDAG